MTYGMPALDATKSQKLDNMLCPQIPKEAKEADRSLGRLQALLLDAIGPPTNVLELQQARCLTADATMEAVTQALHFLGSAHANISSGRRKKVAGHLNKDLCPLVEEADRFTSSALYLFGLEFEKAAKDHVESVHSMQKLSTPTGNSCKGQFFSAGPHQPREAEKIRAEVGKVLQPDSVSSDSLPTNWKDECSHTGHPDGSPVLQEPPDLHPRGLAGGSVTLQQQC